MLYTQIRLITNWEEIFTLDGIQMTGKRPDWAYKGLSELQLMDLRQSIHLNTKGSTPITESSLCNNHSEVVIRIIYSLWKKKTLKQYVELPPELLCSVKTRLLLSNLFPLDNTGIEAVNPGFNRNEAYCDYNITKNYLKNILNDCDEEIIESTLAKFGYLDTKTNMICFASFKFAADELKETLMNLNNQKLKAIDKNETFGSLDNDQITYLKDQKTVAVLNASPGTGKTYVSLRRAKAHLKNPFDKIVFFSLAHKALINAEKDYKTSNLNGQINFQTRTLASIEYLSQERIESEITPVHIIIDESSMISAASFNAILKLAKCKTVQSFTVLGDIKQLGPISGTGCLLDSMEKWFPNNKFTLHICHRSSDVIFNYYMTAAANLRFREISPDQNKIQIYNSPILINNKLDPAIYNMVREIDDWDSVTITSFTNDIINKVNTAVISNMIQKGLFDIHTSYHKDGWIALESLENAGQYEELSKYFYQSEKVICVSNVHEKMKNAEIGIITNIYTDIQDKKLRPLAEIDCGYEIYKDVPLSILKPAYAITVHKMQGSEANLIIYLHNGWKDPFNLAFTAVSRAKELLVIVSPGISDRMKMQNRKTAF